MIKKGQKIEKSKKVGCLMLYFDIPNWKEYVEKIIDVEDLHDNGFEYEPHCTILYGLKEYDGIVEDVEEYLPLYYDSLVMRSNITIFENLDFDVVKFDIESSDLVEFNSALRNSFDYTNEYVYQPHLTIAYVKKGCGVKYIKDMEKLELSPSNFIYLDGKKKKINLL